MTELLLLDGPLDAERLGWVSDLYGQVDPRYRDPAWVRHLLVDNPSGAAAHAFSLTDGRPSGHCVVIPMRTRTGGDVGVTGKIEAFFIEPAARGETVDVRGRPVPLAMAMLREVYDFAESRGMELLHSYSTPELGRLHRVAGLRAVTVPAVMRAAILAPRAIARDAPDAKGRSARLVAGVGQRAWLVLMGSAARVLARAPGRARVTAGIEFPDAALAAAEPPAGRWSISGADAPRWYPAAPQMRVVALGGSRALVRWPAHRGDTAQLVAVDLGGGGLAAAVAVVAATAAAVRRAGATVLRWAPWDGPGTVAADRAVRLLGFVMVERELTLYCRASTARFEATEGFVPTPFIYAIF